MADFDFDLLVIGGGSGGVRAARMAAQRGGRVGLVESGDLGGTCVNVGCIPKKLYSYAAHYAEAFEESKGFGWQVQPAALDWATLKSNRAKEISRLNGIYLQLLETPGVQVIQGRAKLTGPNQVQVDANAYTSRHILVATGGTPVIPDIPGREHVISSDDIFDIEPFPKRLMVVGAGYIACEFASIFNGLGSKVLQVYRRDKLLRGFDEEIRGFVGAEMAKAGVEFSFETDVLSIERQADGLQVAIKTANEVKSVSVDAVLYATGRKPNIEGLGLQAAGVELDEAGVIKVDSHYQTTAPSVYAVGDVIGGMQLTPVALAEAMALVDHLFGPAQGAAARSVDYEFIPTAVFTHPNIGTVGYDEGAARQKFGDITVYRSEFRPLKHTLSGSAERMLMKLIVDTKSDRVVGLHMVGADAGEIVQGFAVAMRAGATKAIFDSTIGIHPTAAEEFVTMRAPRA